MKLKTLAAGLLIATSSFNLMAADASTEATGAKLETDQQKLSYGIGAVLGERIQADFGELDIDMLAMGIRDAVQGKELAMSQADIQEAINKARQAKIEAQQQEALAKAEENLEKGQKFLEENKKADGVITTDSGLQYQITKKGDGIKPAASSEVVVHYEGSLLDGSVFDSSIERGEPARFRLDRVIPGWTEGLQYLPAGSEATLWIPGDLAYGMNGVPGTIGPNELLKFKVQLLEVVPEETAPEAEVPQG
ncbi:FKBP-type peptidyl-prolyl cis-trans isomerase N-terminal domain-containing protein [Endozoicomonadaceae bacterium StTr2]